VSEWTDLLPLGPFPPRGAAEQPGRLDLGALLRDQLLARRTVEGPLRRGLQARLARALEDGQFDLAAELMAAWLDTWPVGAAVDPARSEWSAAPSATALAVLGRAAELARLALGWPLLPGSCWPRPPDAWIRSALDGRQLRFVGRGAHDHRELLAPLVDLAVEREEDPGLPPIRIVAGARLAEEREELVRALRQGDAVAVRVDAPVPSDAATADALAALRAVGPAQRAVERFGPAGAWVAGWSPWSEQLEDAPTGEPGTVLQPVADSLLSPGTPEMFTRGELADTGWLVWAAPFRPVPVSTDAVEVLRALDGQRDIAQLARAVSLPVEQVGELLDELVARGAATAA